MEKTFTAPLGPGKNLSGKTVVVITFLLAAVRRSIRSSVTDARVQSRIIHTVWGQGEWELSIGLFVFIRCGDFYL